MHATPIPTFAAIKSVWESLPESRGWPSLDWAQQCKEQPDLFLLGADEKNGGEVFAVIDLRAGRVVSEDEFPSENFHDDSPLHWIEVRHPKRAESA